MTGSERAGGLLRRGGDPGRRGALLACRRRGGRRRPTRRVGGARRDTSPGRRAFGGAALGVTIARNEEHSELWRHLDVERPAGAWESVVYSIDDLYPDTLDCLERLRADALLVGVAGNPTAALVEWARSEELPVDVVTGSSSLGVRKPDPAFFERLVEIA